MFLEQEAYDTRKEGACGSDTMTLLRGTHGQVESIPYAVGPNDRRDDPPSV
jgi:hypothetical protein